MAQSLKNLESNIGGFANIYLRRGGVSGLTSGIATGKSDTGLSKFMNLGNEILGPLAKPFASLVTSLFGKKTSITGSGIGGDAQSFAQIAERGFEGYSYADVRTKRKFLGVTTSDKTGERRSEIDSAVEQQITAIFMDIGKSVSTASELLGVSTEETNRRLNEHIVSLGRINLKDLKGDELAEALSAVFGAEADRIATAVFPGFEKLARAGEGYYETLIRVASQFELVKVYTDRLGHSFEMVGTNGAVLADKLVQIFGGTSEYQSAMQKYYETF
jgi:hypothetical protein